VKKSTPERKEPARDRKNFSRPLGATLGEQLKEKNLNLFESMTKKEE